MKINSTSPSSIYSQTSNRPSRTSSISERSGNLAADQSSASTRASAVSTRMQQPTATALPRQLRLGQRQRVYTIGEQARFSPIRINQLDSHVEPEPLNENRVDHENNSGAMPMDSAMNRTNVGDEMFSPALRQALRNLSTQGGD